ncbi:MAG TPA: type II toxin-antitoxin system VapC family toxin [Candidatus Eisenbacteria bacterium]
MTAYVDSSVLLRLVLQQSNRLSEWDNVTRPVTSRLSEVECLRTLDRLRLDEMLDDLGLAKNRRALDQLARQLDFIELTRPVLSRAGGPMPTRLRTLEAIHLASALQWRSSRKESIVMATHDRALGIAARASGLEVVGVIF